MADLFGGCAGLIGFDESASGSRPEISNTAAPSTKLTAPRPL